MQALFHFPGIRSLVAGSFTFTPGISPNVCTLYIAPQTDRIAEVGPLTVFYEGRRVAAFPDCKADKADFELEADRRVMAISVLDRRWKWRLHGRISGYYNVRRGESLLEATRRSTRELAAMCLVAMGERSFDVSQLPSDRFPATEWDYDLPAEALARLAEAAGCRVVLTLANRVRVLPAGFGAALPRGPGIIEDSQTLDPPEVPDRLVFVGGRSRFQQDFLLEPVTIEPDGRITPLDEASYKPASAGGWGDLDLPDCGAVRHGKTRELAKRWAYRAYRIATPLTLFGAGPFARSGASPEVVRDLSRILPLEAVQIETAEIDGERIPRPAQVWGQWSAGEDSLTEVNVSKPQPNLRAFPASEYTRPFTLDQQRGILFFADPVFRYKPRFAGGYLRENILAPAKLWLRTTCSLREAATRGWQRYELARDIHLGKGKLGRADRYLVRDETAYEHWMASVGRTRAMNNEPELIAAAKRHLDAALAEYRLAAPRSVTYAGWLPIAPDGAISQVTWSVSEDGYATTRASRNREELFATPSQAERRLLEKLGDALAPPKPARTRDDDRLKDRG